MRKMVRYGRRTCSFMLTLALLAAALGGVGSVKAAGGFSPQWPLANAYHINALDHYSGGTQHNGIDIPVGRGTAVYAVEDGVVSQICNECTHDSNPNDKCGDTWGNFVLIKHTAGGRTYYSRYAHLTHDSIDVSVGQWVSAGQQIAKTGSSGASTGPHLHLELYEGSRTRDKACRSFQYYQDNRSVYEKLTFSSHVPNSSVHFGAWVGANYSLQNGVYAYSGGGVTSPTAEPKLISKGYNMTVDVGAGSTLLFSSTVSTASQYKIKSIPNGTEVYVFGVTTEQYEGRTWAKIRLDGTVGWVNYAWLKDVPPQKYDTPSVWLAYDSVTLALPGNSDFYIPYGYSGNTDLGYFLSMGCSGDCCIDFSWADNEQIRVRGNAVGRAVLILSIIENKTGRVLDTAECSITVTGPDHAVQYLAFSPDTLRLKVGEKGVLNLEAEPMEAVSTAEIRCDNPAVASYSGGFLVTANAPGTATVSATVGGKTAYCTILVEGNDAITVKDSRHGRVTASHKTASAGTSVTLTVAPDLGWTLDALTVRGADGRDIGLNVVQSGERYTFRMPSGKVTVEAVFAELAAQCCFTDVPAGSYYRDAVLWAAAAGVTGGTSATTFEPDGRCTRAQAVTFLWRAAGSPSPRAAVMPFADVPAGSYYYDAVLWAMEQGVTRGTSDTAFTPGDNCSRAQIVTFLYRAKGSPAAGGYAAFDDVAPGAYYAKAVSWAAQNGITGGIGGGRFGSDDHCTRGQIVTFLYRSDSN